MEEQLAVVLPVEVAQIAENVSVDKRLEVQQVLNHVFRGVEKMRTQLDSVVVVSEVDKVNMKLANTIRLGVRQVRLDAEKVFDAKRAEVQQQMLSYKTEDALWLKAKQTMQILTKEIEENARWKEETAKRFEDQQKELKIQQRMVSVSKFAPEIPRIEYELMSDEFFALFLEGLEKRYNDRIEAERKAEEERLEEERIKGLHIDRKEFLWEIWEFVEEKFRFSNLGTLTDVEFEAVYNSAKEAKAKRDAEIEAQRKEAERLKKLAAEQEAQIAKERAEAEKKRKEMEAKAEAERKASEEKLLAERKVAEEKLRVEQEKARKMAEELKLKEEAELAAKKEAEAVAAAEAAAKAKAEKRAKNAPDKEKLLELADRIDLFELPEVKGEEAKAVLNDVKTLFTKMSVFIRNKTSVL